MSNLPDMPDEQQHELIMRRRKTIAVGIFILVMATALFDKMF